MLVSLSYLALRLCVQHSSASQTQSPPSKPLFNSLHRIAIITKRSGHVASIIFKNGTKPCDSSPPRSHSSSSCSQSHSSKAKLNHARTRNQNRRATLHAHRFQRHPHQIHHGRRDSSRPRRPRPPHRRPHQRRFPNFRRRQTTKNFSLHSRTSPPAGRESGASSNYRRSPHNSSARTASSSSSLPRFLFRR